jgi:hypothetical protein
MKSLALLSVRYLAIALAFKKDSVSYRIYKENAT